MPKKPTGMAGSPDAAGAVASAADVSVGTEAVAPGTDDDEDEGGSGGATAALLASVIFLGGVLLLLSPLMPQ